MTYQEDTRLVKEFQEGKRKAYSLINGWITTVVRNSNWGFGDEVQDIVQDIVVKLLENFQKERFGFQSSLKTYVWRVAKYTCIDHLRCRKQMVSIDENPVELVDRKKNPEDDVHEKEQKALFIKIFQNLPRHCQELWSLVLYDKLSYVQIAECLHISEGTVKSRFARCKERAVVYAKKITGNPAWLESTV